MIDYRLVIESLSTVAAAAAARPDVVAARAGMRGWVGVILAAAAIGAPMPAGAATAGNLDDFDGRLVDQGHGALAVAALVRRRCLQFAADGLQQGNALVHVRLAADGVA